jgi:transposase
MKRSGTVHTIRELSRSGKPIRAIARELGVARNTVRKYVRGVPMATPRRRRPSKLDPFKDQIRRWVEQDHLRNCEELYRRLVALGYTGKISILKDFVRPLRPPVGGASRPVLRYESKPGEQMQFDWGEVTYEQEGVPRKVFGFTAVLSYSRMRFVTFVKRTDSPTLIRCLLEAFAYFGGLPQRVLTDRMKTVLLDGQGEELRWHPVFNDLMRSLGVTPRVCKPYTPQTKGKVERSVAIVKHSFWPGVTFTDLDDLNRQALVWCAARNERVHRTTQQRPCERWADERLQPLPQGWVWDRFAAEERQVSWEGYVSYDGVLYGVPASAQVCGKRVQIRERRGELAFWHQGQRLMVVPKQARTGAIVPHPEQFVGVASTAAARRAHQPLGHQVATPPVTTRDLRDYDRLYQVEVRS